MKPHQPDSNLSVTAVTYAAHVHGMDAPGRDARYLDEGPVKKGRRSPACHLASSRDADAGDPDSRLSSTRGRRSRLTIEIIE